MAADSLRSVGNWAARPASIGRLVIPDSRTWPEAIKRQYREVVQAAYGESDPLDVFLFQDPVASWLFLQDAVTGAAILPVSEENWDVSKGFPILTFSNAEAEAHSERLSRAGYRVHVIVADAVVGSVPEPRRSSQRKRAERPARRRYPNVVSISMARDLLRGREDLG